MHMEKLALLILILNVYVELHDTPNFDSFALILYMCYIHFIFQHNFFFVSILFGRLASGKIDSVKR